MDVIYTGIQHKSLLFSVDNISNITPKFPVIKFFNQVKNKCCYVSISGPKFCLKNTVWDLASG